MEHLKKIIFILVLCLFSYSTFSQTIPKRYVAKKSFLKKIRKNHWIAGLSGSVVDDDGKPFNNLFDVKNSWNVMAIPTRLSLEGGYSKNWNIEGSFVYNKYFSTKLINNRVIENNYSLYAFDLNAKYRVNNTLVNASIFVPYIFIGFGATYRTVEKSRLSITNNVGAGLNIWIFHGMGFNIQSMAKFGMIGPSSSNYLLHSVGLMYKINKAGNNRFTLRTKF